MLHAIGLIQSRCIRIERLEQERTGVRKVPTHLPAPHAIFYRLIGELQSIGLHDCVKLNKNDDFTRSYCMVPLWEIDSEDGLGERVVEVFPRSDVQWENTD